MKQYLYILCICPQSIHQNARFKVVGQHRSCNDRFVQICSQMTVGRTANEGLCGREMYVPISLQFFMLLGIH